MNEILFTCPDCGANNHVFFPIEKDDVRICSGCRYPIVTTYCESCSDVLLGKPKIDVEGKVFCYCCAKQLVTEKEGVRRKSAEATYKTQKSRYDQIKTIHDKEFNEWERRKSAYVDNSQWSYLSLFAGIAGLSIVFSSVLPEYGWIFGVIISIFVWSRLNSEIRDKKTKEFSNKIPPPKFEEKEPALSPFTALKLSVLEPDETYIKIKNYREIILKRDNNTCQCCNKRMKKKDLEVHHILPRSQGGEDHPTNLVALCKYCHDREDWFGHVRIYPTTLKKKMNY